MEPLSRGIAAPSVSPAPNTRWTSRWPSAPSGSTPTGRCAWESVAEITIDSRRGPRMAGMLGQGGCHRRRTADTAVARYRRIMKVYECKVCGNRLFRELGVRGLRAPPSASRARTTTSCRSTVTASTSTRGHCSSIKLQPRPVGVHLAHRGRRRPMQRLRDDPHLSQRRRREGSRGVPVAERAKRQLLAELDRLGSSSPIEPPTPSAACASTCCPASTRTSSSGTPTG